VAPLSQTWHRKPRLRFPLYIAAREEKRRKKTGNHEKRVTFGVKETRGAAQSLTARSDGGSDSSRPRIPTSAQLVTKRRGGRQSPSEKATGKKLIAAQGGEIEGKNRLSKKKKDSDIRAQ